MRARIRAAILTAFLTPACLLETGCGKPPTIIREYTRGEFKVSEYIDNNGEIALGYSGPLSAVYVNQKRAYANRVRADVAGRKCKNRNYIYQITYFSTSNYLLYIGVDCIDATKKINLYFEGEVI